MSSLNPLAAANRHKAIGDDLFKKADKVSSLSASALLLLSRACARSLTLEGDRSTRNCSP